jgi:hypothetical protein
MQTYSIPGQWSPKTTWPPSNCSYIFSIRIVCQLPAQGTFLASADKLCQTVDQEDPTNIPGAGASEGKQAGGTSNSKAAVTTALLPPIEFQTYQWSQEMKSATATSTTALFLAKSMQHGWQQRTGHARAGLAAEQPEDPAVIT